MASTPDCATAIPAMDGTLGALYIGIVLAMSLWGVASLQVFYYFTRYPNDDWRLKTLVGIVWALDGIHQGMITHSGYVYLITQYGNVAYLSHVEASLDLMILMSSFLVYRVWKLSRGNIPLIIYLITTVIAAFCFITAYFGKSIQGGTFSNIHSREWLGKASESFVVVSDFSIAGSLIFYLHRSRTGFRKTETMVNRLIIIIINTGLSTSIVAALTLIFLSIYPHKYIYVACFVSISKLYVNSLLATLNCRKTATDAVLDRSDNSQSMNLSTLRSSNHPVGRGDELDGGRMEHVLAIKVDTETTTEPSFHDGKDQFLGAIDEGQPFPSATSECVLLTADDLTIGFGSLESPPRRHGSETMEEPLSSLFRRTDLLAIELVNASTSSRLFLRMEVEWTETLHELQENMTGLRRARSRSSKLTILARAIPSILLPGKARGAGD
ncbi:hypothetical protein ACEPAF_2171 [Sanghuangporus sanghuang]